MNSIEKRKDKFALPNNYYRVTGGPGGEAILFFLDNIAVLYDCGMAYCHQILLQNIEKVLSERGKSTIDYILLSHTHYDHIGALPYVLDKYEDAIVCGAQKCQQVFASTTAINTMRELGLVAMKLNNMDGELSNSNYRLDRSLADGERLKIGSYEIVAIATLGHTDCSMSYYIPKDDFLFTSESTGVLTNEDVIATSMLKDYGQTVESAKKLKAIGAKTIYSPHYGIVPDSMVNTYFDKYIECADEARNFILQKRSEGLNNQEILEQYIANFYDKKLRVDHPIEAFTINAINIIKNMK